MATRRLSNSTRACLYSTDRLITSNSPTPASRGNERRGCQPSQHAPHFAAPCVNSHSVSSRESTRQLGHIRCTTRVASCVALSLCRRRPGRRQTTIETPDGWGQCRPSRWAGIAATAYTFFGLTKAFLIRDHIGRFEFVTGSAYVYEVDPIGDSRMILHPAATGDGSAVLAHGSCAATSAQALDQPRSERPGGDATIWLSECKQPYDTLDLLTCGSFAVNLVTRWTGAADRRRSRAIQRGRSGCN